MSTFSGQQKDCVQSADLRLRTQNKQDNNAYTCSSIYDCFGTFQRHVDTFCSHLRLSDSATPGRRRSRAAVRARPRLNLLIRHGQSNICSTPTTLTCALVSASRTQK